MLQRLWLDWLVMRLSNTASCSSGGGESERTVVDANGIADVLRQIQEKGGDSNFVIFTADVARGYYIQFAGVAGGSALRAEAVSNQFLAHGAALSEDCTEQLTSMGWDLPNPNFVREYEAHDEADRLAIGRDVMRAFLEVYGISRGQPILVRMVLE